MFNVDVSPIMSKSVLCFPFSSSLLIKCHSGLGNGRKLVNSKRTLLLGLTSQQDRIVYFKFFFFGFVLLSCFELLFHVL
jgi:hypothetical protein